MTRGDARRAIAVGLQVIAEAERAGLDIVAVGEMGIGNTTAASAITAALTGAPPERVTGRGTGLDDAGWRRKVEVVAAALRSNPIPADDPLGVLAAVGGLEIAALVGVILGAVAARRPVVLDGFITGAAALIAQALAPGCAPRLIAAHRSVEPGHGLVLERLGLRPLLELDLRLGEGTGAALALGLIAAAVRLRDEMATFESAAVAGPDRSQR
jgi:nicotinate-nucleotide--dimethylbenzimidazole phosphoribosyltransferase